MRRQLTEGMPCWRPSQHPTVMERPRADRAGLVSQVLREQMGAENRRLLEDRIEAHIRRVRADLERLGWDGTQR